MDINLTPQTHNLILYAGDGASIRITATQQDGTPIDLTGTITAQIRAKRNDAAPLTAFAVDLTDATDGVALLQLTGAQTTDLINGADSMRAVWDVQWAPTDAEPVTLLQGAVKCNLDVTRS